MNGGFAPIPGQTPIDDLSGLRIKGIRTREQLDEAEAENVRRAVVKYLSVRPGVRAAPFDLAWVKRLHAEMFGDVWSWAGKARTRELNLGSAAHQIEPALQSLLDDAREWGSTGMPLLEQATRLHHRAVSIHPFLNGNGRWARLLANVWLARHGAAPVEWPEATIGATSDVRGEYLAALRAADGGDMAALLALHERFASRAWRG